MELRATSLVGTDLVALSLHPSREQAGAGASTRGMPLETIFVDQAAAHALGDLTAAPPCVSSRHETHAQREARVALSAMILRARRHQRPPRRR